MLQDGSYAAWFKTPQGQGTGIVHVGDGQVWGCDGVMTYCGSCTVDGDTCSATVSTKRHTNGLVTVFGTDDELQLRLVGMCSGKIAAYVGTAEQFLGVVLEGFLILTDQPILRESIRPAPTFDPQRLPKLRTRSR